MAEQVFPIENWVLQMSAKSSPLLELFEQLKRKSWTYDSYLESQVQEETPVPGCPIGTDAWQEFKRKFVETYGGETVQEDGLTHSEFLRYLKDVYREGDEPDEDSDWYRF